MLGKLTHWSNRLTEWIDGSTDQTIWNEIRPIDPVYRQIGLDRHDSIEPKKNLIHKQRDYNLQIAKTSSHFTAQSSNMNQPIEASKVNLQQPIGVEAQAEALGSAIRPLPSHSVVVMSSQPA